MSFNGSAWLCALPNRPSFSPAKAATKIADANDDAGAFVPLQKTHTFPSENA
jgi:hypothetical protein